jgi:hypothetical protein
LGVQVSIDTSDAGFQTTPCYFAWLNGPLVLAVTSDEGGEPVPLFARAGEMAVEPAVDSIVAPLISLAEEKTDGFTFRVLLPPIKEGPLPAVRIAPAKANELGWTVSWLGIEH